MKILVTVGATREFFDPVRYISNPSSGKMGNAIAMIARDLGWEVEIISANCAIPSIKDAEIFEVTTGAEMLEKAKERFRFCDVFVSVAAVCDFRPKHYASQKLKKDGKNLTVEFEQTEDILKTLAQEKSVWQTVVGFAAETNDIENYALKKLAEKNLDLIVANRVGRGSDSAFGSNENAVVLLGKDGFRKVFPRAPKIEIARSLMSEIAKFHLDKVSPRAL